MIVIYFKTRQACRFYSQKKRQRVADLKNKYFIKYAHRRNFYQRLLSINSSFDT
jgi:hypothetical protein